MDIYSKEFKEALQQLLEKAEQHAKDGNHVGSDKYPYIYGYLKGTAEADQED